MKKLYKMIENKINQEKKGYATKLAHVAGYKTSSSFNKVWKENREFDSVTDVMNIIREAFPHHDENELLTEYALELNPNRQLARQFLEYARLNKLDDLTESLINKLKNSTNEESKEWSAIYEIDFQVSNGLMKASEAIKAINEEKVKTIEMEVFGQIVQFYNYFDEGLINSADEAYHTVNQKINIIESEYIKAMYWNRLELIRAEMALHKDELEQARKYALLAEQNAPNTLKCFLNLRLGNSYIFESYDEALKYLQKAKEYAEKVSVDSYKTQVFRSLNFLHNYYFKKPDHLIVDSKEVSDLHEVAFYYIRNGNPTMGLKVLDEMKLDELTNIQKGFHFFYRGLATNDDDYYYNSIEYFKLAGEKFYRKAPLIELQKMGVKPSIIRALSV